MSKYNLLTEKLIHVRYKDGSRETLTLPSVLAKLSMDDIESFCALQAHQEQAWYCFMVQLAAMAMYQAGTQEIAADEDGWRRRLRSLTKEFPNDEPWCMVVEDLGKPAFMQTPVPESTMTVYKNKACKPDEIDIIITAKNHDVKAERILNPNIENWIFALLTLQTMQGFLGKGNYGIVRMNGGFANRPFLGLAQNDQFNVRFKRDAGTLLQSRDNVCNIYGYREAEGMSLLWLKSWDGRTQLMLNMLDPYFIEICRRTRFIEQNEGICCCSANTSEYLIANEGINGKTGDPWNAIQREETKSFSLAATGYDYKILQEILFGQAYEAPSCLQTQKSETGELLFIAKGMVRGQGITEGLHERKIPIPGKIRFLFDKDESKQQLSKISKQMITDAADFINKVFKIAVYSLHQPGRDKFDFNDKRPQKWSDRLNYEIDRMFFEKLWEYAEGDYESNRYNWLAWLRDKGHELLEMAFTSVPLSSVRKYKTVSAAEGRFTGSFYKTFEFMKSQNIGATND